MSLNVDFKLKAPANTPVWVDEAKCKSCDLCVEFCPTGVFAGAFNLKSTFKLI